MRCIQLEDLLSAGEACHVARSTLDVRSVPLSHTHDFHELFWIVNGLGHEHFSDHSLALAPGTLRLVPAQETHALCSLETGEAVTLVNVAFSVSAWDELRTRYDLPDLFRQDAVARCRQLAPATLDLVHGMGADLLSGARSRCALDRFLLNLTHHWQSWANPTGPGPAPAWLRTALEALRQGDHLAQGVPALIGLSGRSPEHLARECRRWYGCTPTDLVNRLRLEQAGGRLLDSDEAIIDIAIDCGFGNLGHFYQRFRSQYGTTPARWRSRARQNIQAPG